MSGIGSAALLVTLAAAAAHASPMEAFGLGPRNQAMGSAATALATDYSAGFYNPAGSAFAQDVAFGVGYQHGFTRLRLGGADNDAQDSGGTTFGLVIPHEIHPPMHLRFSFSLDLLLPDREILRVRILPASRPHFFMYDNRVNRIATDVAVAIGVPGLAVGAGASILADTAGRGVEFEISTDLAATQDASARLGQSFPVRAAPIAGIMYMPWDWITLGLSYRGPIKADVSVATVSKIVAPYIDNGAAVIGVTNTTYYSPPRISLGLAFDRVRDLTLAADLTVSLWSRQPDPAADIQVLLDLQKLNPSLVRGTTASAPFADTVTNRIGAEYRFHPSPAIALAARAGYVYEPTPVPAQTGATNYMDSDKHVVTAGVGLTVDGDGEVVKRPVSLDAFTQVHLLERRLVTKSDVASAVPPYWFDGTICVLGLSGTLRF
jgi:long-chain fatty acid transport protein